MFANDSVPATSKWPKSKGNLGKQWSKQKLEINKIYTVKHFFWICTRKTFNCTYKKMVFFRFSYRQQLTINIKPRKRHSNVQRKIPFQPKRPKYNIKSLPWEQGPNFPPPWRFEHFLFCRKILKLNSLHIYIERGRERVGLGVEREETRFSWNTPPPTETELSSVYSSVRPSVRLSVCLSVCLSAKGEDMHENKTISKEDEAMKGKNKKRKRKKKTQHQLNSGAD